MKHPLYIAEDSDTIQLREHASKLRIALHSGLDLFWNREGRVRVIPNAALLNALHIYDDFVSMTAHVGGVMPADVKVLRWEQGLDLTGQDPE